MKIISVSVLIDPTPPRAVSAHIRGCAVRAVSKLRCPVCQLSEEYEGYAIDLSHWEVKQRENLGLVVNRSWGEDRGVYCNQCGVLSRVVKEIRDEVVGHLLEELTTELLEEHVQEMGLRTVTLDVRNVYDGTDPVKFYRGDPSRPAPVKVWSYTNPRGVVE